MSKRMPIAISNIRRHNSFASFDEWYKLYRPNIEELYKIMREHVKDENSGLFNKMDFQTFVSFVYYYSNKMRPEWYLQERRTKQYNT